MSRAAMLPPFILATILICLPATAATPREASELALRLVRDVASYSASHPDAAGAFAPWVGIQPAVIECVPIEAADGGPAYYRVLLGGREPTYVVLDAHSGRWVAYGWTEDAPESRPTSERPTAPANAQSRGGRYPDNHYIPGVPHYYQSWSNNCGPTAIEMAMDFWGPHVPQMEVTYAANNPPNGVNAGATDSDMLRAIQFSAISNAVGDTTLWGYSVRKMGYAAAVIDWDEPAHFADRYDDIKRIVSTGIPFVIKTRFAEGITAWHVRVIRGYDDATDVFITHDPWYGAPFSGPDVHFNQSYLVDTLWPWNGERLGFLVHPWEVRVCVPPEVAPGERFTVGVAAIYPGPDPYFDQFEVTSAEATLELPPDLAFAPGETPTKPLSRISLTGSASGACWEVVAGPTPQSSVVSVLARGLVTGTATSYGNYADSLGAYGTAPVNTVSGATPQTLLSVDAAGSGDYETIQEALCAADPGDTVVVAADDYSGLLNRDLDVMGKAVLVTSETGRSEAVIDCGGRSPAFRFDAGETPGTVVEGLCITNGASIGNFGGGVLCTAGSSPTLRGCTIENCTAVFLGGGVYCEDASSPVLDHLVVRNCSAVTGSAIHCRDGSDPTVSHCTLYGNTSVQVTASNASPTVTNTIIAASPTGPPLNCLNGADPTVTHCVVYGNASGDSLCGSYASNLFVDPLFCDAAAGILSLCDDSPCLPTGNPWGEQVGALEAGGCGPSTGVEPDDPLPGALALGPARPNPFAEGTRIAVHVPAPGARLQLAIYDIAGRRVRMLAEGPVPAGRREFTWDGTDDSGALVATGVYLARCVSGSATSVRKLVLVR